MNLYQHFRKEEHHFIDQVLEWREAVKTQYCPKLTDFLDPREQEIVRLVIGHDEDVNISFFGGASFVERQRALLYPPYFQPEQEDFAIALFAVCYPSKFVSLEHRQVLGSLMSLGLKRGKFGDILIKDEHIQLLVAKEVADYVRLHLEMIGKTKISLEEKPLTDIIILEEQWNEATITVSSLRLDTLLSQAFHVSRQKTQSLIENGLVKVNWKVVEQAHFECKEGDTLSVRGFGRCKIFSIDGKTKKEKWRVHIGTQK
ncbi:YlmH family RNA-binding protein [Thermaerobacillus caldiproteolyticus]|uniref:RNA-binding protein YlmH n=1 Tax=Thermaerobacillus caldiproteolyticus TaxID=247480 RepID=A0A7V9Z4T0_9BACL|nr:RNA-binding protein [Anoxybacillus caldiproteolyticus]MBA2874067.1 RNA-binding protein YlmH [Anoxybacillus caldiproteolyticus]QPA31977.1 RNA-binding protein [Anoxybacillus caldiproteolyticus]